MWILTLVGVILGVLMLPVAFALGVYVPLIVSDVAHNIFQTLGGKNWARDLFGSNKSNIGINLSSPWAKFLIVALIIGVLTCVIWLLLRWLGSVFFNKAGKMPSVNGWKYLYGILAIIIVPIMFFFLIGVTGIIFQALSFDTGSKALTQGDIDTIKSQLSSALGFDFNTMAWGDTTSSYADALQKLYDAVKGIYNDSSSDTLRQLCQSIMDDIDKCRQYATTDQMNNLIQAMLAAIGSIKPGQRLDNFQPFQDAYINLLNASASFQSLVGDLNSLWGTYHPDSLNSHWEDIQKFINGITNNVNGSVFTNDYYKSIMYYFSDWNYTSANNTYTISGLLPYIFSGTGQTFQAGAVVKLKDIVGLGQIYTIENPINSWTFNQYIYQYITGQKTSAYSFWMLYLIGSSSWAGHMDRYIIGVMVASISMSTMMMYAWYIVGRVLELAVFWLASIIISFTDDVEGKKFNICMKTIFTKIFGIITIEAVFSFAVQMLNADWGGNNIGQILYQGATTNHVPLTDLAKGTIILIEVLFFAASFPCADMLNNLFFGNGGIKQAGQELQSMWGMGSANRYGSKVGGQVQGMYKTGSEGGQAIYKGRTASQNKWLSNNFSEAKLKEMSGSQKTAAYKARKG